MDEGKRRDKLDDALLFIMGSVGILFGIVQLYVGSLTVLVIVIPVALLGWILPFYFGYIRGAMRDSMADRYRAWVVLVVGLGLYAVILNEEEITRSLPDQRFGFIPAFALLPAMLLARKYQPRFRRFVLGPGFQKNPIVSESAMNLVWAAVTISFPAPLLAIATFLNIWDVPFVIPFALVAIFFIRRSNFFADRVSWEYTQVPKNGRLYARIYPKRAYRVLKAILLLCLGSATVSTALSVIGHGSVLLSQIFSFTLGLIVLLAPPAWILRFLLRTGRRFVFTEPTSSES